MKIAVMGYSGSGKSTLTRALGTLYQIPVLHLDSVQFLPGWQTKDAEEARREVAGFMKNGDWVIDGNYNRFYQKERLYQADVIIILLFPRFVSLWRCFKRYRKYKNITREDMAPGCNEKLDAEFVRWILWEGRTREKRAHYRKIANMYANKTVILRTQRQIDRYLKAMKQTVPC